MSLYKRGETWWVRFTTPAGQRVRQSTGTANREAADGISRPPQGGIWRVERLGEKATKTWNEAAVQWLKETTHKATHEQDQASPTLA